MAEIGLSERLSWRDPDGFVVGVQGRILRAVAMLKSEQTRQLVNAPWMVKLMAAGRVPKTVEISDPPPIMEDMDEWLWLEHDALPLACHPHEITALQLYDSGMATLEIALEAANHGWTLKDASAWNVLHSQGRAVFVDFLSFEKLPFTGTWVAYGQFVRHFVLPLLLNQKLNITPAEIFLINRDGITPERAYQLLKGTRLLSAAAFEFAILPKWLSQAGGRKIAADSGRVESRALDDSMGRELMLRTLGRLRRVLQRLCPERLKSGSGWESYEEDRDHYSAADLSTKTEFVRQHLDDCRTVLDLGCNAGEFSLLAAASGKSVVAADADHPALSRLYARIRGSASLITPLLLNIGRPTPAVGWANREIPSFLDRSSGKFECILMLGLMHHLIVSERATLAMVTDLLDQLDPKRVILEWVDPQDRKFQQLAGLNRKLYTHLDTQRLEDALGRKFRLSAKSVLPCATRTMYLWSR